MLYQQAECVVAQQLRKHPETDNGKTKTCISTAAETTGREGVPAFADCINTLANSIHEVYSRCRELAFIRLLGLTTQNTRHQQVHFSTSKRQAGSRYRICQGLTECTCDNLEQKRQIRGLRQGETRRQNMANQSHIPSLYSPGALLNATMRSLRVH